MKIKVVVHEAEEGGYWAEVPAIPGCATQGETMEELMANINEAVVGCLDWDGVSVKLFFGRLAELQISELTPA